MDRYLNSTPLATPTLDERVFSGDRKVRERIAEFEGLRGILAWWVVVDHILLSCGISAENLPRGVRLLGRGDYAVDLFIILSGFVIFKLIADSREPYGYYLIRRYFRIYPVMICCLLLSVAAHPLNGQNLWSWSGSGGHLLAVGIQNWNNEQGFLWQHIAAHLSLLHGAIPERLLPGSSIALLAPAWSISLEWQFYLVAPLLVALLARYGTKGWLALGIGSLAVAWLCSDALRILFPMQSFLPQKFIYFLVGMLSFFLWDRLVRRAGVRLPDSVVAGICPLILYFSLLIPLAIWALVLGASSTVGPLANGMSRFLRSNPLQVLGRISYSTYLVHTPCLIAVQWAVFKIVPRASRAEVLTVEMLIGGALVYFVSRWLYAAVEAPGISWGRKVVATMSSSPRQS